MTEVMPSLPAWATLWSLGVAEAALPAVQEPTSWGVWAAATPKDMMLVVLLC